MSLISRNFNYVKMADLFDDMLAFSVIQEIFEEECSGLPGDRYNLSTP